MSRVRRLFPVVPIALVTAILAWRTLRLVLATVHEPCATLDDAFIHFQYARAIAELHPFRYQASMPPTSGGTSILWPLVLAPFHAVGFRGMAILWPAWALGFLALGALAFEAHELAKGLAGRWGAVGAAGLVLAFAGFTWCAASGMEVVPFAWSLARSARRASEYAEDTLARTPRARAELVVLAFLTALLRPEGALMAVGIAVVLLASDVGVAGPRARGWGLVALAAAGATPFVFWVFTGSPRANTTTAKLLLMNPYQAGSVLWTTVGENIHTLVRTLLNGQVWSAEFVPTNALPVAIMAVVAVPLAALQRRRFVRGAFVLGIAAGMVIPCFYGTFLWNRLRYLWPFATGWLLGLVCLASVLGELAAWVHPRARAGVPMLLGGFVGAFAVRIDGAIDDVANSASGIDRQHVRIGRWARDALPVDALVAVNDTGAIAYMSDRRTFDVVGLTTAGEARYWVAGAASRIEHYERMRREDLPTHFIVYPAWMGTSAFFGERLFDATVVDSTILGGQSMVASTADWSLLGSGELPWTPTTGALVDALDVADLESEAAHSYELLAVDNAEVVGDAPADDASERRVLDGGRGHRTVDRFVAKLPPGRATHVLARLAPMQGLTVVDVRVGGHALETLTFGSAEDETAWKELTFDIAANLANEKTPLELVARGGSTFASYHYWFFITPG